MGTSSLLCKLHIPPSGLFYDVKVYVSPSALNIIIFLDFVPVANVATFKLLILVQ